MSYTTYYVEILICINITLLCLKSRSLVHFHYRRGVQHVSIRIQKFFSGQLQDSSRSSCCYFFRNFYFLEFLPIFIYNFLLELFSGFFHKLLPGYCRDLLPGFLHIHQLHAGFIQEHFLGFLWVILMGNPGLGIFPTNFSGAPPETSFWIISSNTSRIPPGTPCENPLGAPCWILSETATKLFLFRSYPGLQEFYSGFVQKFLLEF